MRQSLINENQHESLKDICFLVGNREQMVNMKKPYVKKPFATEVIDFLSDLSKKLMSIPEARLYPDIVTFGFWIRKASLMRLNDRFNKEDGNIHLGRGVVFHIAPSNVPVNYAYSLAAGLLMGNINIVRVSTKDFPQVNIINSMILQTLESYPSMKEYIYIVKYGRDETVNNIFSSIADVRVVWGGDNTIKELRKSMLQPRSSEVNFADRYSLAVIDSDMYLALDNQSRFAEAFYNDTYLMDQNACTSPRIVIWLGNQIQQAKAIFWEKMHDLVASKYEFNAISGVNKLTSEYMAAARFEGIRFENNPDNLIVRVNVKKIGSELMDFKDNSGFFFEYDCTDIIEIVDFCDNTHCQTIGYLADKDIFLPLLQHGISGIDRIVPIGSTMKFDLLWDGYNLYERLTRTIAIS